jgi:hypothetical protein
LFFFILDWIGLDWKAGIFDGWVGGWRRFCFLAVVFVEMVRCEEVPKNGRVLLKVGGVFVCWMLLDVGCWWNSGVFLKRSSSFWESVGLVIAISASWAISLREGTL